MMPAARDPEQVREVLVGAILPARAPDALESGVQAVEVLRGTAREVVRKAVHKREAARGRFGLVEAEKGDDTIYVDQEERRGRLHRSSLDVSLKVLKAGALGTDAEIDRLARGPLHTAPVSFSIP